MRIFLSYPHERRHVAERIKFALEEGGHEVFFDRSALAPGEGFLAAIRQHIARADLFVFVLSPESVEPGRFDLTELELAEKKWPRPHQRVLPVLVAPVARELLPPITTAVGILEPRGDVAADVSNHVERLGRRLRGRRRAQLARFCLGALTIVAAITVVAIASRGRVAVPWIGYARSRATGLAGTWHVAPESLAGGGLPIQFSFDVDRAGVSGMVFYAGQVRRMENAAVSGDTIRFSTRRSYAHEGQTVEETDRYEGTRVDTRIDFLRTVERRGAVIAADRFTATRTAPPAARGSAIACRSGEELGRLELHDEDASKDATVYLVCGVDQSGQVLSSEDGITIEEEPFGHLRHYGATNLAAIAGELQRRQWRCARDVGDGRLVAVNEDAAADGSAPRYIFCHEAGGPLALHLRVAPRRPDGSLGPDRRIVVALPQ